LYFVTPVATLTTLPTGALRICGGDARARRDADVVVDPLQYAVAAKFESPAWQRLIAAEEEPLQRLVLRIEDARLVQQHEPDDGDEQRHDLASSRVREDALHSAVGPRSGARRSARTPVAAASTGRRISRSDSRSFVTVPIFVTRTPHSFRAARNRPRCAGAP
jgi:hypothetical protein